jgi:hypothetical protein
MKLKYIVGIYALVFCILLGIGIYAKSLYKDFNKEEEPLNNFSVGLMTNSLVKAGINVMESELEESNIILAVECKEKTKFQYSCATQKVEVKKVFKGNDINVGSEIELCTVTDVFMDENMYVAGKPCVNLDFVNEMKTNKIYLVFLDRKLKNSNIYIKSDRFFIKPVFCYEQIKNYPCKAVSKDQCSAPYMDVSDNEFFVTTQKGIDKIENYKNYLINKYTYSY